MLLCSAKSSGMRPQSSSAPELEEMVPAQEGGLQAALLWAGLCPASFCRELESKGEGERSQAAST